MLKHKIILLLFLLAGLTFGYGQSQLKFLKIDRKNGLSNEKVNCIVKKKNGFVWVGTANGLNRFDGKEIKVYNKQNSSLSSNDISDILIDKKGRMLVGVFGGGLNIYSEINNKFSVYKKRSNDELSLISNEINVVFQDSKGRIWLGTRSGLSNLIENEDDDIKTFLNYDTNNSSLSHNDIRTLYEDSHGILWIGTHGGGLISLNPDTNVFKTIKPQEGVSIDFIHTINGVSKNKILIGTNGDGLIEYNKKIEQFSHIVLNKSNKVNIVRRIIKDSQNNIWIGTDGQGLFVIENISGSIQNFINNPVLSHSISSNSIHYILEDENTNLWIGTAWEGLNVTNINSETFLVHNIEKNTSPVLSIHESKHTEILGLDGGGLIFTNSKKNKVKHYGKDYKYSSGGDYIQFIKKRDKNKYWLGTFVNGLIDFDESLNTYKSYKHTINNPKSISYDDVRYVVEDEKENLWVATWGGGLNYFEIKKGEFLHFKKNNTTTSISSNNVVSMQKDNENLWLATFGGGLNLFNIKSKEFQHFKHNENDKKSIGSDYLYCVLKDSKGNVWVGTSADGINFLSKETGIFNRFEEHENIKYQIVVAIIEDNNGLIWFSTKQGIFNYNYETNNFTSFTNYLGEYHINAVTKDEKGHLYFGSTRGVVKVNPEEINLKISNPVVKLTGFKLFNKEVPIGKNEILQKGISFVDKIELAYRLDVMTFEFAALQFPSSEKCEYAIKMDNFDDDWRVIGKERTATYTNLSPGNYIFKVKSKLLGNKWGDNFTNINVKVLKPFWLTWWAFLAYGMLIVLVFYLFRKYIIAWEQLKTNLHLEKFTHEKDIELHNLKQQFFTNISHEIRTPVTLILGSINRLLQVSDFKNEKQQNPVKTLKKSSTQLMKLIDELLDFRKLDYKDIQLRVEKGNWANFCEEIYLSFKDLGSQNNIEFSFENNLVENELWFDKNQMDKVLYNLLSNAIKFTESKGEISLTLSETKNSSILILKDRGVGMSKKQISKIFNRYYQTEGNDNLSNKGFGLGLTISEKIIKLHHGSISVESKKGVGSAFRIILKKGKNHFKKSEIREDNANGEFIDSYINDNQHHQEIKLPVEENTNIDMPKTILVVEDNIEIQEYIVSLLFDQFKILKAENGKEALEIINKTLPDLIISDVMMPVMNGIELTKEVKSNITTSHIPILLLTARVSVMHKKEGFDIGADDYITKPFNEVLLRSRVENVLKNRDLLHKRFQSEELIPITVLAKNEKDQEFLKKLGCLIDENIDSESLNTDLVTKELGMSRSVIYKKLKALTGLSIIEFIRDYKLKIAKQLLIEKGCTVAEACYHIGYSDRKYFSKQFKQRFGKTPSEFIRKI